MRERRLFYRDTNREYTRTGDTTPPPRGDAYSARTRYALPRARAQAPIFPERAKRARGSPLRPAAGRAHRWCLAASGIVPRLSGHHASRHETPPRMTTAAAAPAEATAIRKFLRGVFAEDWRDALWTGFTGDPRGRARGDWAGWDLGRLLVPEIHRMPPTARMNMYFCPSLVTGRDRCLGGFRSFHVVVYDDYGCGKVPAGAPERLLGTPSYMIET